MCPNGVLPNASVSKLLESSIPGTRDAVSRETFAGPLDIDSS
jgi:hypothetical protein